MIPGEILSSISPRQVQRALDASTQAGSMDAFYPMVGMTRKSRTYFIQYRHRLHSLKAIVTHAGRQIDPKFSSDDFQSGQGARRLKESIFRSLGFAVVHNLDDADKTRERKWIEALARPGQLKFRERLIDLYGKCAITNCSTQAALEAAHVVPVADNGPDAISNGILLRADLHKLFDADLMAVDPLTGSIHLATSCRADYHPTLKGCTFNSPAGGPTLDSFQTRWERFNRSKETS